MAEEKESLPQLYEKIYIQKLGETIGQYGSNAVKEPEILPFDSKAEKRILGQLGDVDAIVKTI